VSETVAVPFVSLCAAAGAVAKPTPAVAIDIVSKSAHATANTRSNLVVMRALAAGRVGRTVETA